MFINIAKYLYHVYKEALSASKTSSYSGPGSIVLLFYFLFQVLVREKQQKAEQIKRTKDLQPSWESVS